MTYLMRMFLAFSLLTSERVPSEAEFMFANPALVAIGRRAEVLKEDETLLPRELKDLRNNLRELQNAPPMSATYAVTGFHAMNTDKALDLNNKYREHLKIKRKLWMPRSEFVFQLLLRDTDWRWDAWDALDGVVISTHPAYKRRWAMKLINCIGEEAFYRGEMPFPIPEWALEELR